MKKTIVCLCAMVLALVATSNVLAVDGAVSNSTLSEMGLSGIQTMSDTEALAVRAKGFVFDTNIFAGVHISGDGVAAGGGSYASIQGGGLFGNAEAGTVDGFVAFGQFSAGGTHVSEAFLENSSTTTTTEGGMTKSVTQTHRLSVGAGGSASGMALSGKMMMRPFIISPR